MNALKKLALTAIIAVPAFMMAFSSNIESAGGLTIGQAAPDFTLTDINGTAHTLSDYTKAGNIVVLEWFSPDCPFVRKHYRKDTGTMINIQADNKDEKIVWLRINSAHKSHASANLDHNTSTAKSWNITTPILMDGSGKIGKAYGAKRTPDMYIINPDQTLAYHGAIDNRPDAAAPGDTNYVQNALTELLAGQSITKAETKPYGCSIKYD